MIECLNIDCDGILEPITSIDSLGKVHMYICDTCFDRESGDIKINLDLEYYKSVLFYTKHHYWEEEQSDRIIRENSIIEETEKRIKELETRKKEFVNMKTEIVTEESKIYNKLVKKIISEIELELSEANMKFGAFSSEHEGYAVILEELDELWDVIKNEKSYKNIDEHKKMMKEEAIQVAAMAFRFIIDVCEEKE